MKPLLRPIMPADVPVLAVIYQSSIDELAADDYDEAQRAMWASAADNLPVFGGALVKALTVVATQSGSAVGFITMREHEEITMLYVYPKVARQGVASLLLDAIEKIAANRGAKSLFVDASDAARPFFEARKYKPIHRKTIAIGDQWLGTTRMEKTLSAA